MSFKGWKHNKAYIEKLKQRTGSNNPAHKLTSRDVLEIRGLRGKEKQLYLAIKYEVSQQCISSIQLGRNWKHPIPILKPYGVELILDLHECENHMFQRKYIRMYFKELCEIIGMKREKLVFWDDVGVPENERQELAHTKGTTAVQFILTSNITIHTLDLLDSAYINIFSCKEFDHIKAKEFSVRFFQCKNVIQSTLVYRG